MKALIVVKNNNYNQSDLVFTPFMIVGGINFISFSLHSSPTTFLNMSVYQDIVLPHITLITKPKNMP
jgi:hypothetical protein